MKSKSLIGLGAVLLLSTGIAQSGDDQSRTIGDQNLSKRPYHEAPAAASTKGDEFEGATLVKEANEDKAQPDKYQQLRIRMLGRQPYMEGK